MSFLDGILSKSTPAERNHQALTQELELRRSLAIQSAKFSEGYAYHGAGDLLLRHGQFYPGRVIPDKYVPLMGRESECFTNALYACEADPDLRYCEGVYFTGQGCAKAHGWCLDPNGEIVEVTLPTRGHELGMFLAETGLPFMPPERWGYWGAIFNLTLVRTHGETLGLPMLDRSGADMRDGAAAGLDTTEAHDFPVLRVPYDPNRTELP